MTQPAAHAAILGIGTAQPEFIMTQDEAVELWGGALTEHDVDFETAFPDVPGEEA